MKLIKKATSIALMGLMTTSVLVGCGGNDAQTSGNAESNSTANTQEASKDAQASTGDKAETSTEVAKPDSIHWMVHSGMNAENGTDQWVAEFEKMTGIDMNLEMVSNNEYTTILELAFASGTVPDVFDLSGDNFAVYVKQNALADLTDLVKETDFYSQVDPAIWDAVTLDGKIYGIPMEIPSGAVTYVRKDWLDRLDMEIPTNYDEFIEMLTAFKNDIPECTVPLTAPGLKASINLPEFFLGANPDFIKKDGVWVNGMLEENMAGALQRLQDAYKAGLIDMEVVTNTTSNCRDQWYSGSVGVFNYWGGLWGKTLTERLQANVPEAEVVALPAIEGAVYEFAVPSLLCISADLPQEKIEGIFKYFMEYMHDGGEGQVLFQSGVEGIHWEQQGDNLVQLPTLSNPDEIFSKAWITPWMTISPLSVTDKNLEVDPMVTDSLAIINEYGQQKAVYPVSATLTKIKSDLTLVKENVIAKVVMGEMTVEEGLKMYADEADILNAQQVVVEMNE